MQYLRFATILVIGFVFITGCTQKTTSEPIITPTGQASVEDIITYSIPEKVAKLPTLADDSIDSYEKYKDFADKVNHLVSILEEQGEFDIPEIDTTLEGYQKMSKTLTKYGPLIGNYNEVIKSAKDVTANKNNVENIQKFYKSSAIFGAEVGIIYVAVFATSVYQGIGIVYRASGIQSVAFKCGSCVSTVLSETHWFVRTALVEGSSQIYREILDGIRYLHKK